MRRAMELAELGRGWTKTNPVVGAVLVKEDRIIGEGYHKKFGGLHAEREALADCRSRGEDPAGADLYVTLEPCCHYGKTPPCTQAVIEAGISHVFVGAEDINPLVAGAGIRQLREQGLLVTEGVLQEGMRVPKSGIFSLYPDKTALCADEICDDTGWKNSVGIRKIAMDHRRGGKRTGTPHAA